MVEVMELVIKKKDQIIKQQVVAPGLSRSFNHNSKYPNSKKLLFKVMVGTIPEN